MLVHAAGTRLQHGLRKRRGTFTGRTELLALFDALPQLCQRARVGDLAIRQFLRSFSFPYRLAQDFVRFGIFATRFSHIAIAALSCCASFFARTTNTPPTIMTITATAATEPTTIFLIGDGFSGDAGMVFSGSCSGSSSFSAFLRTISARVTPLQSPKQPIITATSRMQTFQKTCSIHPSNPDKEARYNRPSALKELEK